MKKKTMRIVSVLLCVAFLILSCPLPVLAEETEPTRRAASMCGDDVRVRSGPGTNHVPLYHNNSEIRLNFGHPLVVLGDAVTGTDTNYPQWYQAEFTYNGSPYVGYIYHEYVTITPTAIPPVENPDFETQLAAFPEYYHTFLRALHEQHPSWNYEAFQTNLDWNYVQERENRSGFSLINDGIESHYSTAPGSYNWETDTYVLREGSNWYQAAPEMVAYYMDPRNFLNEADIFQFEKLTFSAASQTEENIALMLKGTFMEGKTTLNNAGEEVSYARAFLDAAYTANVSAFHLVTRCIQEVGWGGSDCVHGNFSGFEGYYNFFNIGAYGGAYDGMVYAKNQGWDTPYKAILAGGSFIGNNYIAVGQDTPYFQKYNVINPNNVGGHQYMTNVAAALSEGRIQKGKYVNLGFLETGFTFRIPVYQNLPEAVCQAPAATGSPNNYLVALSIDGYSLTPSFDFYDCLNNGTNHYSLIIESAVSSVTIHAAAAGRRASVTGDVGTVSLAKGENNLTIRCTAANGISRDYTLTIIVNDNGGGMGDDTPSTVPSGWNPPYQIQGTTLSGLRIGMAVKDFLASLGVFGNATASMSDGNGNAVSDTDAVRTGMMLHYFDGKDMVEYSLVLYGDANGDSAIDAIDLLAVRKNLLGLHTFSPTTLISADVNRDGVVDAIDLLMIRKHLLELITITQ